MRRPKIGLFVLPLWLLVTLAFAVNIKGETIKAGLVNADGKHPDMVYIPPGEFNMGSDDAEIDYVLKKLGGIRAIYQDEKPRGQIYMDGFWMDIYEVTNEAYEKFVKATDHLPPAHWKDGSSPSDRGRYPVVNVSWYDALEYCRWAGKRLPTEAQWEKAARGPNGYRFAYGDDFDERKANVWEVAVWESSEWDEIVDASKPVGSYQPNGYGLYDMTGNVWEWTSSFYGSYPYRVDREHIDAGFGRRVLRGGSWYNLRFDTRTATRSITLPEVKRINIGFRCAQDG